MCKIEYDKIMQQAKNCMINNKCSKCASNIKRGNSSLLSCIMNKYYLFIDTKTLTVLNTSELCDTIIKIGDPPQKKSYIEFIINEINELENLIIKER